MVAWSPKSFLLKYGTALLFISVMHSDSFSQLNLVDQHITGATMSLCSTLVEAVLFLTVGVAWMSAASTVTRVL